MHRYLLPVLLLVSATVHAETDWTPIMAAICDATNAPITTKGLGTLCAVANKLPSEEEAIQQSIYKIVCAGLVAIGDEANFEKLFVRVTDQESGCEYVDSCYHCYGRGYADIRCSVCGGSGRCPACRGQGGTRRPGLRRGDGSSVGDIMMPCARCGRSGDCDRCKGKGTNSEKCTKCSGKGKSVSADRAKHVFWTVVESTLSSLEERQMMAKGLVKYHGEWMTPEEMERRQKQDERDWEELDAAARELAERMRNKGLEYIDGKWMTPGSLRNVPYDVFQIYAPGHALCQFPQTGRIFCLLFSADDNRDVSEGDKFRQDLYRCGVYSYTTVQGAPSTIAQFAIDLEVALKEIERQK